MKEVYRSLFVISLLALSSHKGQTYVAIGIRRFAIALLDLSNMIWQPPKLTKTKRPHPDDMIWRDCMNDIERKERGE